MHGAAIIVGNRLHFHGKRTRIYKIWRHLYSPVEISIVSVLFRCQDSRILRYQSAKECCLLQSSVVVLLELGLGRFQSCSQRCHIYNSGNLEKLHGFLIAVFLTLPTSMKLVMELHVKVGQLHLKQIIFSVLCKDIYI